MILLLESLTIFVYKIQISENENIFKEVYFSKTGVYILLVWRMNPTSRDKGW